MKIRSTALAITLLALSGCWWKENQSHRPIAKVDEREIETSEFGQRLAEDLRSADPMSIRNPLWLRARRRAVLDTMIAEMVVLQWAKQQNHSLSEKELDDAIAKLRKDQPDEAAFRQSLLDNRMTYDRWREKMRIQESLRKVYSVVTDKAGAKPLQGEALEAQIQQIASTQPKGPRIKLRQILLRKEDDARRIYAELGKGADMARLAKSFSVGPEAERGGETDWIEKGTLDVFDPMFALPVGGRSNVVQSPYGWHIMEVLAKQHDARPDRNSLKEQALREWRSEAQRETYEAWLKELIRASKIVVDEKLLDAIEVTTRSDSR